MLFCASVALLRPKTYKFCLRNLYSRGTTQPMNTQLKQNVPPNRLSLHIKAYTQVASESENNYRVLQTLIRKTMEQLLRPLVERIHQLDRKLDSEEDNWETISGIQRICSISFYKARRICLAAGVRSIKSSCGSWPRYNVEDCKRILAEDALPTFTVSPVTGYHRQPMRKKRAAARQECR